MTTQLEKDEPIVSLDMYEMQAMSSLNQMAFDYLAGGSGDGYTLRRNREAFQCIELLPKVLVDVSKIDTHIELFSRTHKSPILLAPTGYHRLFHPEGELETVRGANRCDITLVAACFSTIAYEEMQSQSSQPLWFQLYLQQDQGSTQELVERVIAAGCEAICVTVDFPVNSPRDSRHSTEFRLPDGVLRANLIHLGRDIASASHRHSGRNIYNGVRAAHAPFAPTTRNGPSPQDATVSSYRITVAAHWIACRLPSTYCRELLTVWAVRPWY
jgi:4-hydroxymandelate oxidase